MKSLLSVLIEAGQTLADPRGYRMALIRGLWPRAVGATNARRTTVVDWQGDSIRVRCASLQWKRQMEQLGPEIIQKLRCLGPHAPSRIEFVAAAEGDTAGRRRRRATRPRKQKASRPARASRSRPRRKSAPRPGPTHPRKVRQAR
ncbi:MAG: DciA family protein [Acidobacteriota bacterium]